MHRIVQPAIPYGLSQRNGVYNFLVFNFTMDKVLLRWLRLFPL